MPPQSPPPLFIICAQYENPLLDLYGLETAYRIAMQRRAAPRFLTRGRS